MLQFLLMLLCWSTIAGVPQETLHSVPPKGDATRPYIHYCRSPNMETFTCWWHPLDNGSQDDDNITYSLMYTMGKEPPKECPDYVSGGPNSCYFDTKHTLIWHVYCMKVTARSRRGVFSSDEHCLDVVDIVEIDPPFNLTYALMNISEDESGRTTVVSWQYPIAQHVHMGWITLIYELRFRPLSKPNKWKVKEQLREPHLELLDLPVGNYEVQVRCRSKNNHLWSKWSSPLTISIPARRLPELDEFFSPLLKRNPSTSGPHWTAQQIHKGNIKRENRMLYAVVLVSGIGITTLLIIGFGVIPRGKRIKAFLLPPIPKPRIRGIDPMLLKKGKMEEINRHFSLHGYKPPQYREETWYQVSVDDSLSPSLMSPTSSLKVDQHDDNDNTSCIQSPTYPELTQQLLHTTESPTAYCQDPAYFSKETLEVALPTESPSWVWPASGNSQPELVSFPGMDYSMILNPTNTPPTPHDFYTCVNGVTPSGAVQLVPCVSNSVKGSPYFQLRGDMEDDPEKSNQLVVYLEKQSEASVGGNGVNQGEKEQSEFAVPLLPHLTDRS